MAITTKRFRHSHHFSMANVLKVTKFALIATRQKSIAKMAW
jgi:hypothetical protein